MAVDPNIATVTELAKRAERLLYGKYRGMVYDNKDPAKRGRLRLLVPSVFGHEPTDWVPGAFPLAGGSREAFILVPEKNSHVLVEFVEGDRSAPIWTAAYYPDKPEEVALPQDFDLEQGSLHLVRTRGGIAVRFEDDGENTQVIVLAHPGGGEIRVDQDGITTIKDQGGAMVTLDPKAKVTKLKGHGAQGGILNMTEQSTTLGHGSVKIELSGSGIMATGPIVSLDAGNVLLGSGAASPVLDAMKFASFYDAHLHPVPSAGATAIPTVPLTPALASVSLTKVKGA